MTKEKKAIVIGGGLAGCEAAYQLSKRGISVTLYEQKPLKFSPAHHSSALAEVVCSNSFKSTDLSTASGLLKAELEMLDSIILKIAKENAVPAGGALAVNRDEFSKRVTEFISGLDNVTVINEEVAEFSDDNTIIATGPLTDGALYKNLTKFLGEENLHFYDASAPIVSGESIDYSCTFKANRRDNASDDYVNCPLNREEYYAFVNALISAECVTLHDFEKSEIFEGCMPIEVMAKRGADSLRFGPMRPVGLVDSSGKRPFAVVQLRRENTAGSLFNLVGFQTNLTFGEQKRVFSLIPALKSAEFVKLGVMHRNSFVCAPKFLEASFRVNGTKSLYIAGQLSGVEGYMESTLSGLVAGVSLARTILGESEVTFSPKTMTGAIINYLITPNANFQPMNANFGILQPLDDENRDKKERKIAYSMRAIREMKEIIDGINTKTDC